MSDTILGMLIGGAIGVIPTFSAFIISSLQRRHEVKLRKLEIYSKEKLSAIVEYSSQLGAMSADRHALEYDVDHLLASAQRAACFTSEATRTLIFESGLLLKRWRELSGEEEQQVCEYQSRIAAALSAELSRAYDQVE